MEELVSIIVPVYNCEKYIEKCIESLINQTYFNIEIIAINDGSTDKSKDILEFYSKKDKRVKVINKNNEGVSKSRNIGIDLAKGEYITFVDADDWLECEAIEILVKKIKIKNVDVIRYNTYINKIDKEEKANLYELENQLVDGAIIEKTNIIEHFLCVKNPISNLVMLLFIKSDILKDKLYFEQNLFMMEDVVFYQLLFEKINSIYFLGDCLYHYRINDNSATKSSSKYSKNIYGIIDVNKVLNNILTSRGLSNNNNLIKKMNANQLKIISNYLCGISRKKINQLNPVLNDLLKNKLLIDMLNNSNLEGIPKKNKLIIRTIKTNNFFIVKVLFYFFHLIYKIKGV